ncbi:MAG: HAD family hydrolase [Chloroflexota bacterium]
MLKTVIFDWGDTLMRDDPNDARPMAVWPRVEAMPGAAAALSELSAWPLTLCVASNAGVSDADLMGQALARVGLRRFFEHLWTSKELGVAKPDRRFFTEAARRAGCDPTECIMVGNDYVKDICGANKAGLRTVWVSATATQGGDRQAADSIIGSLAELPAAVKAMLRQN